MNQRNNISNKPENRDNSLFRQIPGVDLLIDRIREDSRFEKIPHSVIKSSIQSILKTLRATIREGGTPDLLMDNIISSILKHAEKTVAPRLVPAINATGVVLHTNLGRAPLAEAALNRINGIAKGFSNLEFDISRGKRGERYSAVETLICQLTGAEAALAVNNNAAAVLLSLNTLAEGDEVVVSRGELVEIGGSFRIPDVMTKSGCILKEVGTTNRTHLKDYENAVTEKTGLFLKVHTSNYTIEGFTSSVPLYKIVELARKKGLPVMEDLGSGSLIDLSQYGLGKEPTVQEAVASGADIITFSGDKLLGGPQAGIIAGNADIIRKIKSNPLTRALRIDKLTLAALEATLSIYRDEAEAIVKIPTLKMLTLSFQETASKTDKIVDTLKQKLKIPEKQADIGWADLSSRTGGGSYPELPIASRCVTIIPKTLTVTRLEKELRMFNPAIIGRIDNDRFIIDPRTLQQGEEDIVVDALATVINSNIE
ncbi:L-seryl-tRNA(Sec) selenium transferase [Desulfamplus magnetovallimortis]|nr:L-seryl-tRNA(Sec) selenium transferase [Desulfamplus magnetovallimortis]